MAGKLSLEGKEKALTFLCEEYCKYNYIDPSYYEKYRVKRGLRNDDGSGVLAGVTQICNVHGYVVDDGEKVADYGKLIYRGIDINDIVEGCLAEGRYGFEEVTWLLLFGYLPDKQQLEYFNAILSQFRELPDNFEEDMILKAPSKDVMNKLARSVLALYSYDDTPDDLSLKNVIRQSMELIARMPTIMSTAYRVKRRVFDKKSLVIHHPEPGLSTAQNILLTIHQNRSYTEEEAILLDLCLILHAEHGGGNNSTFSTRVLTSSGTDTYSAIAAGIGSLKGPRHGGANHKVREMMQDIKKNVSNWENEDELAGYLAKIINKEAGDRSGLIYGMGHAVYTLSDPRAVILKKEAYKLARKSEYEAEFNLMLLVEKLTPEVFAAVKGDSKVMCANVDMYSGLVYTMLGIPEELHTPLFAVSRTAGWCAHRMEELLTGGRIIRPAYKPVAKKQPYVPLADRKQRD